MLKTDKLSQQVYEFLELPDLEAFFVQFLYGLNIRRPRSGFILSDHSWKVQWKLLY